MQVTVQVSADVARPLHRRDPPRAESTALVELIEKLGLTLEPMHYGTTDPKLQSYFTVEVPDSTAAQRLIDALQQSEGVVAAYVKPRDELP
jgi:hypothetical protein